MSLPLRRAEPRSSIFDLLVWDQFVGEGVLRHTDGALSRVYRYRGPDLDAATADQLGGLSRLLTTVLSQLGDGWMVHFDALRLPAPAYPGPAPALSRFARPDLDREREEREPPTPAGQPPGGGGPA